MAKYGRFDPRNKKRNKHKTQSLEKDIRIREEKSSKKQKNGVHSSLNMVEYIYNEGENDDEIQQGYSY